jgi:hypothetical protein
VTFSWPIELVTLNGRLGEAADAAMLMLEPKALEPEVFLAFRPPGPRAMLLLTTL